jgi:hypothetical protein
LRFKGECQAVFELFLESFPFLSSRGKTWQVEKTSLTRLCALASGFFFLGNDLESPRDIEQDEKHRAKRSGETGEHRAPYIGQPQNESQYANDKQDFSE